MNPRLPAATGAPLVSVLTPSFNQASWLESNLRSVEAQTYRPVEHIVVDGGSLDGSVDILRRSTARGLKWISEGDDGQADALNKALSLSTGEIIGWINSDDAYIDRRAIAWAVDAFVSDPLVDVVYGEVVLVDASGLILQAFPTHAPGRRVAMEGPPIMQPAAFVRRSALDQGFIKRDLQVVVDAELWVRLWHQGRRFKYIPRIVAIDRHHPDRKIYQLTERHLEERHLLAAEYGIRIAGTETVHALLARLRQRCLGVARLLTIESAIDPAIPVAVDGRLRRAQRQLITRRRNIGSATGRRRRLLIPLADAWAREP